MKDEEKNRMQPGFPEAHKKKRSIRQAFIVAAVLAPVILILTVFLKGTSVEKQEKCAHPNTYVIQNESGFSETWCLDCNTLLSAAEIISDKNIGRILCYGVYEQDGDGSNGPELLRWKVIDEREDRLLLLSEIAWDCISYHDSYEKVGWKNSDVYRYLNEKVFGSAFSPEQREHILQTDIGRLFLFSKDEFCKYYACYQTNVTVDDGYERDSVPLRREDGCLFSEVAFLNSALPAREAAGPWMLRTDEASFLVKYVDKGWNILSDDITAASIGIRPLMWVTKEALGDVYGICVEISDTRKPLYRGDMLSLEPGEVFTISNNGKEPLDIGRLIENSFPIRYSGINMYTAEVDGVFFDFTYYAEKRAVALEKLKPVNVFFHAGYTLREPDLYMLYDATFLMEDNTVMTVGYGAELLSDKTIMPGQQVLRFRFRGLEFEVPITVLPAEGTGY